MVGKTILGLACVLLFGLFSLTGCTSAENDQPASPQNGELIYEETISPNEDYVENEADIVTYTLEIYQQDDNTILLQSKSNAAFFEPLQQEFAWDGRITSANIEVVWTTLTGNPSPTEADQLSIADVSFTKNGETIDEVKINFVNRGLEIVADTTAKATGRSG